ncbi:MAG: hypothetical protein DRQ57_19510 [Gammaproteobacteria bacterium]|nr:MAG: hypothetical protein DRQ57_19510 [Gammaproteobacteria bacterium]
MSIPISFFEDCAFVSVDFQGDAPEPGTRGERMTKEKMLNVMLERGIDPDDINAAKDFATDVANPNAVKVANACREIKMPMIFVHWGYMFKDAMDLDPIVYDHFVSEFGPDASKWLGHHIDSPNAFPMRQYDIRVGEYILPKTAMDAFPSSNIDYVLRNLKTQHIVFVGGNTGGCLGTTAYSARQRGYKTLIIEDATFDSVRSTQLQNIYAFGYDYLVKTKEFLALAESRLNLREM